MDWAIELTPLADLLDNPLRINKKVLIHDRHMALPTFDERVGAIVLTEITLAELIHGNLWELSFYRTPEERAAMARNLREMKGSLDDTDTLEQA